MEAQLNDQADQRPATRRRAFLLVGGQKGVYGLFIPMSGGDDIESGQWPLTFWGPEGRQLLMGRIIEQATEPGGMPRVVPVIGTERELLSRWLDTMRYMDQARRVIEQLTGFGPVFEPGQAMSILGLPGTPIYPTHVLVEDLEGHQTWLIMSDGRGQPIKVRRLVHGAKLGQLSHAFSAALRQAEHLELQLADLP
jgi:hypothetical protein